MQDSKANERKVYYRKRYITLVLLFCILLALCLHNFFRCKNAEQQITLNYEESNIIDYNVYLKENNFFENDHLTKSYLETDNHTIITQLIDYFDVYFDYKMDFDKPTSGTYKYYVKGVIEANKDNAEIGNYWTKEIIIDEGDTKSFNNESSYSAFLNVKINYDEYSNLLADFKKEFNLAVDGILKVYLVVESNINDKDFKESKLISTESKMEIPLTKSSAQISLNTTNANKTDKLVEEYKSGALIYKNAFINLIIDFAWLLIIIALFIIHIFNQRRENYFEIKLNKILNTYDGIIVNASTVPDIRKFNVIKVDSFDDLIDAHSEVRMPINYCYKNGKHIFILVNNDMLWIYVLKKGKRKVKNIYDEV